MLENITNEHYNVSKNIISELLINSSHNWGQRSD